MFKNQNKCNGMNNKRYYNAKSKVNKKETVL